MANPRVSEFTAMALLLLRRSVEQRRQITEHNCRKNSAPDLTDKHGSRFSDHCRRRCLTLLTSTPKLPQEVIAIESRCNLPARPLAVSKGTSLVPFTHALFSSNIDFLDA
jgi:hypothetical protein